MKNFILLVFITAILFVQAQDNLVPNATFQTVVKKVKSEGQINLAEPWTSPTLAAADLYVKKTKNSEIGVPANAYGSEKPMEGDNYAGILAYSYKNKEPRSYLQAKLTEKLKEGKQYCVTVHVSLADISKYATDRLGVALSNQAIKVNNSEILQFSNTVVSRKLTLYDVQFYWTPICGIYKAKGDEEYITIGNFTPDEKLKTKKVKRPKGFTKPQTHDAYYYIDNVSVIEYDNSQNCDCDTDPNEALIKTVRRDFNSEGDATGSVQIVNTDGTIGTNNSKTSTTNGSTNSIDGMTITFEAQSFSINEKATSDLNKVIAFMKENPDQMISVKGHMDASEKAVLKLDGKRSGSVYKYIVSQGIAKERVNKSLAGVTKDQNNMKVVIQLNP